MHNPKYTAFGCFNTQPPEGGWGQTLVIVFVMLGFQHTAARRRLAEFQSTERLDERFQHTAARRRLGTRLVLFLHALEFQHTAARRRLAGDISLIGRAALVSTHSRPKAAGYNLARRRFATCWFQHTAARRRLVLRTSDSFCNLKSFNTQPPEGGWADELIYRSRNNRFNTQPPEGGWFDS